MKIAITGGIGSGKSYVCRILEKQGIRVYDCDDEAKRLMRTDARLQAGLKKLVGDQVYSAEGVLQKPVLAQFLLAGEANKQHIFPSLMKQIRHLPMSSLINISG